MRNFYYLFVAFFSFFTTAFSQTKEKETHNCAADNLHLQELKNNPDYKRNFESQNTDYQAWVLRETKNNSKHTDKQVLTPPNKIINGGFS